MERICAADLAAIDLDGLPTLLSLASPRRLHTMSVKCQRSDAVAAAALPRPLLQAESE